MTSGTQWFLQVDLGRVPDRSDRWDPEVSDRWDPEGSDRWDPEGSDRWDPEGYDRWDPDGSDMWVHQIAVMWGHVLVTVSVISSGLYFLQQFQNYAENAEIMILINIFVTTI